MNKLGLSFITLSAILLSSCGGGGGDTQDSTPTITDQIRGKHAIMILHNFPETECKDPSFIRTLESSGEIKDVLISVESNDINCAYYGRENNDNELAYYKACVEDTTDFSLPTSCVIGFNDATGGGIAVNSAL